MRSSSLHERDLELARRIHFSLLPMPFQDERMEFALAYDPIELIGGDYCHVAYMDPRRVAVCVSDVTGHGVPAALVVGRVNSFVQGYMQGGRSARDMVCALNKFLCAQFMGLGLYLTCFAAVVDPIKRRINYVGAGHPPAIVVPPRGRVFALESQNCMLGVGQFEVEEAAIQVQRGTLIVLLTDGILEARNGHRKQYGLERVMKKLTELRGATATEAVTELRRDMRKYSRGRTHDDCLLMAIRLK